MKIGEIENRLQEAILSDKEQRWEKRACLVKLAARGADLTMELASFSLEATDNILPAVRGSQFPR